MVASGWISQIIVVTLKVAYFTGPIHLALHSQVVKVLQQMLGGDGDPPPHPLESIGRDEAQVTGGVLSVSDEAS